MSTSEGGKKIPEWSIFDRLDEVEKITLELMEKAGITEPTLKETSTKARDAIILAEYAFVLGAGFNIAHDPHPRVAKDASISLLKKAGLSQEILDGLDAFLIALCEAAEKGKL